MLRNSNGQSIIQVLVSLAISSIVILATVQILELQNHETRATQEKMSVITLQNLMLSSWADGSACGFQLTKPGPWNQNVTPITFDAGSLNSPTSPPRIELRSLLAAADANAATLAEVNQLASPISNSVVIKSISITNIQGDPSGNAFTAQLNVDFDGKKLVRALKPAILRIVLKTSGAGNAKTITGCSGGGGADLQGVCNSIGGRWDPSATPPCTANEEYCRGVVRPPGQYNGGGIFGFPPPEDGSCNFNLTCGELITVQRGIWMCAHRGWTCVPDGGSGGVPFSGWGCSPGFGGAGGGDGGGAGGGGGGE